MKISEKQVVDMILTLHDLVVQGCLLRSNEERIRSLLQNIRDQQSDELKEIE